MNDRGLGPRPGNHMGKFGGNISSAHKRDPIWQSLELEKLLAGGEVLPSGNSQRPGTGADSNDDIAGGQRVITDPNGVRTGKFRDPMEGRNASLLRALLAIFWHRVGERP